MTILIPLSYYPSNQKLFRRRMDLNLELFVRDNPAVAIALVGYYLGIVIALGSALDKTAATLQDELVLLVSRFLMKS